MEMKKKCKDCEHYVKPYEEAREGQCVRTRELFPVNENSSCGDFSPKLLFG